MEQMDIIVCVVSRVFAVPVIDRLHREPYLIGNAVPAVVKGTGSVLWWEGHHHKVVTGPGRVEQYHHGSYGGGLAHGRTLHEGRARTFMQLMPCAGQPCALYIPWIQGKHWPRTFLRSWRCRQPVRRRTAQTGCRWSRPEPGLHVWSRRHCRPEAREGVKPEYWGIQCNQRSRLEQRFVYLPWWFRVNQSSLH